MKKNIIKTGPDISVYQGIVNMKQVRESGCGTVWLRAGYGKNNVDQKYIPNAQACYNLGIPAGIYWFSYAYTSEMAEKEADYAIAQAAKFWTGCPIAYDFEYDSTSYARKNGVNVTRKLATDLAIAFLKRVKEAGYIPILYTNNDYTKNYFDISRIRSEVGDIYIWYARYAAAISSGEMQLADAWQHSSTASVPGIVGNVDMNNFYVDFPCRPIARLEEEGIEGAGTEGESLEAAGTGKKPEAADTGGAQAAKCNINILDFQKAANTDGWKDMNGNRLAEDGMDGPKTQYVRRKIYLKAQRTLFSYKSGSAGAVVKWWQRRCNEILGHDQEVDGMYGKISRSETIAVQQKLGLAVDGIAGYNSIQAAFYN